jgi:hypothetical protein
MRVSRVLLVSGIALLSVTACGARQLSPEEQAQVQALRNELKAVQADLSDAQQRDNELAGGLVKALVAVRLEVLRTNKALLEQRISALESGAKITVETRSTKPDDQEASRLEKEIAARESELSESKAEAERYGGLVGALKASTVATQEQSLAMLKQRYLMAKYGLTLPSPSASSAPVGSKAAGASAPEDQTSRAPTSRQPLPQLPAADGPFGLQAGLSKAQVEQMLGASLQPIEGATFLFTTRKLPKPHPSFESYALLVTPGTGLCQIRAIGADIASSSHGLDLRGAFDSMYSSLSEIYGHGQKLDQLLPGSIWHDPQDWMMGLLKKERILQAEWSAGSGSTMRNNLQEVYLVAKATSGDTGYLLLQYNFSNDPQCQEELKNGQRDSL